MYMAFQLLIYCHTGESSSTSAHRSSHTSTSLKRFIFLFQDLSSSRDAQRERVFLVCQIIRIGRMDLKEPDSKKHTKGMRRPFGVAAIEVMELFRGSVDSDEEKQYFIPFLQSVLVCIYINLFRT